ncbi:MAG: hypothetical protein WDO73_32230 [Ignavibacteriota bacterium]
MFLGALLDEIDMFAAHNDSAGARRIAEQAAHLVADSAAADYADLNNLAVIEDCAAIRRRLNRSIEKPLTPALPGPNGNPSKRIWPA